MSGRECEVKKEQLDVSGLGWLLARKTQHAANNAIDRPAVGKYPKRNCNEYAEYCNK